MFWDPNSCRMKWALELIVVILSWSSRVASHLSRGCLSKEALYTCSSWGGASQARAPRPRLLTIWQQGLLNISGWKALSSHSLHSEDPACMGRTELIIGVLDPYTGGI